ncbi:30S ribosomal protein S16 [Candidatus Gracilibacteria bacterium]|nr:30S ribosomal protein S16 [Candidatus Gracilibacteria bacterium]
MLTIRLARVGRENLQKFRLVAQEKTKSPKSGKVVAIVGSYDPIDPENKLIFDAEKIEQFIKNGAELSDTLARLLLKNGFKKELAEKFVKKYTKQKSKKDKTEDAKKVTTDKPSESETPTEPTTDEDEKTTEKPETAEATLATTKSTKEAPAEISEVAKPETEEKKPPGEEPKKDS